MDFSYHSSAMSEQPSYSHSQNLSASQADENHHKPFSELENLHKYVLEFKQDRFNKIHWRNIENIDLQKIIRGDIGTLLGAMDEIANCNILNEKSKRKNTQKIF
jgi:hypothetical protein